MLETIKNVASGWGNKLSEVFGGGREGPPVFNDDLVEFVDKEYKRRIEERRPFEIQWRLNLAFYEGNQFVDINTASMALEEQPILYDWEEREVFNHVAPNIEARISKLKRIRSLLKVRPGTTAQKDVHSAKVGSHILKTSYDDQNMRDKYNEELSWMEVCGTVFEKRVWNPKLGAVIGVMESQDPETGEAIQEEVYEGNTETIVCPPQEILPDSCYHQDVDSCKSIIHHRAIHVDQIFEEWGVRVSPEKAEAEKLQKSMIGTGGLGYGQGGFRMHTVKLENHAIVKEYSERPSKKYPQGRFIVIANGKLLHAGPLPFMVDDDQKPGLPFVKLVCLQRPGCFWGKTVLERLIPVQRRYNALRNRKAEYLNRCAIGQWFTEEESVDESQFAVEAGMPGAIHTYRRGTRLPEMVRNPPLPAAFETEEQTLLSEFAILSGVSEVSRDSSVPSGVNSGVAIGLLKEQDDTRLSNTADNVDRFMIQGGKMELRLNRQFVTLPRTLHSIGKDNVAEVIDWTGSDLHADDVILDCASAMTESPIQRRAMVFDLIKSGLMNDPETGRIDREMRSKIFEIIEFGEWESADDEEQLHLGKAERENRMLEKGRFAQPVSFDDHVIHISRHNKYRLTTDYEELIAQTPMIDKLFAAHVEMHMVYMQQAVMAQMQQQMATQQNMESGEPAA